MNLPTMNLRPYNVTVLSVSISRSMAAKHLEDQLVRLFLDGHEIVSMIPHPYAEGQVMVVTKPRFDS